MIHTARQSPKFVKLVRRLRPMFQNMPVDVETIAVGLLERMWHLTIGSAKRGDIGRFDDESIAEAIGWFGDPSIVVAILVESGWLDRCQESRLVVHDWAEHAPAFIKRNIDRIGGFVVAKRPLNDSGEHGSDRLTTQVSMEAATHNITQHNVTKQNRFLVGEGPPTWDVIQSVFIEWNQHAAEKQLTAIRACSEDRKAKIRTRLRRQGWLDDFRLACEKLPIPGDGWQPDLDWMIANDSNVVKVLEGKYDWRNSKQKALDDFDGL